MTSMKRIPTVKTSRRNNADPEREQFERTQEASFRKGISDEEMPVKMKHVRTLIIGTHTDKSGLVFWRLVSLAPPLNTDVTSWKFCHCVHLILRDGHINFIKASIDQIGRIKTLGEHFRHLPVGYGELVKNYCDLLVCKLTFHQHYPRFPGHLQVTPEELSSIAENDANNYFQMAVEMLDYMETILNLYTTVFKSLNPSRSNSMTKMGQCRLSSLIPCIQDSSCLYDLCVRILFQLHKAVPDDMLSGHRKRFNSQFRLLQQFYNGTRNLQYFKMLVQVPHLPQNPPNFLVEAELGSHVAPVVVLEAEPMETLDSMLVDTVGSDPPPIPPHPHPDVINSHNGSLMDVLAEKESLIEALQEELRTLRVEIQKDRSMASFMEEKLKFKICDFESHIAELESELVAERRSKEAVLQQVEVAAASADAVTRLAEEENRRHTAEEKFSKMKEVYQKLREEHISLIRAKSELEKALGSEKEKTKREQEKREEHERNEKQIRAQISNSEQLQKSFDDCLKEKDKLEIKIDELIVEKDEIQMEKATLETQLLELEKRMSQQAEDYQQQLQHRIAARLKEVCLNEENEVIETGEKETILHKNKAFIGLQEENVALKSELESVSAKRIDALNVCDAQDNLISDLREELKRVKLRLEGKIDDLYTELEAIQLKRQDALSVCDLQDVLISDLKAYLDKYEQERKFLIHELATKEEEIALASKPIGETEGFVNQSEHSTQTPNNNQTELRSAQDALKDSIRRCVSESVNAAVAIIDHSVAQFENSAHLDMKSTTEYTLLYQQQINTSVNSLIEGHGKYMEDVTDGIYLLPKIEEFSHYFSVFLLYAKASSHTSPNIEVADDLVLNLENIAQRVKEALDLIANYSLLDSFNADFGAAFDKCCLLVSKCEDVLPSSEDLASTVQSEMEAMDRAINEAVQKFSTLLDESRAKDTGMQLEVNEGILGTCGDLMAAVRLLVQRSSALQKEIVAAGKGGASPKEFYKRNHRWTEGLISGAKTVAIACQALVMAADQVANGKGKFEEVIVASREIAASSMQLVMASRVKAHRSSDKLANLNQAAKTISTLTGTVVATAESCREELSEATVLDFSNLSLHSTKRLEMETMVKMLETEKQLETERNKLAELRRHHYKLARESEGLSNRDEQTASD